jgi:hypothetical protein
MPLPTPQIRLRRLQVVPVHQQFFALLSSAAFVKLKLPRATVYGVLIERDSEGLRESLEQPIVKD